MNNEQFELDKIYILNDTQKVKFIGSEYDYLSFEFVEPGKHVISANQVVYLKGKTYFSVLKINLDFNKITA